MKDKIRIAVIFGGRSAEHEVSLQSAKNVIDALDREKYDPVLIGIDREGRWFRNDSSIDLLNTEDPRLISLNSRSDMQIVLTPDGVDGALVDKQTNSSLGKVDVIFPVLHGPYGEDGSIQGLAKLANIPCVGADILGSAVGMDKDVMKRLLRDACIPISPFRSFVDSDSAISLYEDCVRELGSDLFIKPANLGSSVGITHARTKEEFEKGIMTAFEYDTKVIVEQTIKGREIEVSVLGNSDPVASVPGEIIAQSDFYSYEAKYIDEHGAVLEIPAKLDDKVSRAIRDVAVRAYKVLCLKGMSRVDFFLTQSGEIIVNEVNTIPGFTRISMYPKLWEKTGISYSGLIDTLVSLSLEDFAKQQKLRIKPEI